MIKYDGKPFNGVSYNQGAFAGDRGHLFIGGEMQCNYGINPQAKNRIWQPVFKIAQLEKIIADGSICKQCVKNVTKRIEEYKAKVGA